MNPFEEAGYIYPEGAEKTHRLAKDSPVFLPDGTPATILDIEDGIAHCTVTRVPAGSGVSEISMESVRLDELIPCPIHPLEYLMESINEEGEEDDEDLQS